MLSMMLNREARYSGQYGAGSQEPADVVVPLVSPFGLLSFVSRPIPFSRQKSGDQLINQRLAPAEAAGSREPAYPTVAIS
jgi:hypothetical protein